MLMCYTVWFGFRGLAFSLLVPVPNGPLRSRQTIDRNLPTFSTIHGDPSASGIPARCAVQSRAPSGHVCILRKLCGRQPRRFFRVLRLPTLLPTFCRITHRFFLVFVRGSQGSEVGYRCFRPFAKKVGSSFLDNPVFYSQQHSDLVARANMTWAVFT